MSYQKVYEPINWEDEPSEETPVDEENLGKIDRAVNIIDDRVVELGKYKDNMTELVNQASESAANAANSETISTEMAKKSSNSAVEAESYAHGETGTRENENIDNAKYYYEQTKRISQAGNGLVPMGTITFEELPTEDIVNNAMYNISDNFTSDDRFEDGGGIYYGAGNNVIYTANGKWDVLAASAVTGIKGEKESTYRQGNVNITCDNIGALSTTGDSKNNVTTFTEASSRANIASGEKHSVLFGKIKKWFSDLKTGAFATVANNDTTTAEGYVADARIVKAHGDEIDSLNSGKADKATTLAGYGITDAQSKLTNPLTKSDVVNNLTSTSTNTPLSAYQGNVLNTAIGKKQDALTNPLTKSDVVNNLTTTTTNVPLSAAQGKVLNDAIASTASTRLGSCFMVQFSWTYNLQITANSGSSQYITVHTQGDTINFLTSGQKITFVKSTLQKLSGVTYSCSDLTATLDFGSNHCPGYIISNGSFTLVSTDSSTTQSNKLLDFFDKRAIYGMPYFDTSKSSSVVLSQKDYFIYLQSFAYTNAFLSVITSAGYQYFHFNKTGLYRITWNSISTVETALALYDSKYTTLIRSAQGSPYAGVSMIFNSTDTTAYYQLVITPSNAYTWYADSGQSGLTFEYLG